MLCARRDSVYKEIPGLDVYDEDRDAFSFRGDRRVLCHPPCRLFGRLSQFVRIDDAQAAREVALGLFCGAVLRGNGGVLEHPAHSRLFSLCGAPGPGFIVSVPQFWFGHRALKETWLWFVGVERRALPSMPFAFERYTGAGNGSEASVARMGRAERERTPPSLARWLVEAVS